MKKNMSYEEARKYIAGEEFDAIEYERKHLIMLRGAAETAISEGVNRKNLRHTVGRWIRNHENTIHQAELEELRAIYNMI